MTILVFEYWLCKAAFSSTVYFGKMGSVWHKSKINSKHLHDAGSLDLSAMCSVTIAWHLLCFNLTAPESASCRLSHLELPTAIPMRSTKLKWGLHCPWAAIVIATATVHSGTGKTGNTRGKRKISITCCCELQMGFYFFSFSRKLIKLYLLPLGGNVFHEWMHAHKPIPTDHTLILQFLLVMQ